MACNHTTSKSTWVPSYVNDWGYEEEGHWHYETVGTYEDIDLHRYRCTKCGEVFYYSGRARDYYEKGIKSEWITGLDK
jgi:hypothetical protein